MKLYLARHGDNQSSEAIALDALSTKGKQDIKRLAMYLSHVKLAVSSIFYSEKQRARETAEILAQGVQCFESPKMRQGLGPTDGIELIYHEISHADADMLVVSHQPLLMRLAAKLLTGNEYTQLISFNEPGTMICLENDGNWHLQWMLTPEILPPDL